MRIVNETDDDATYGDYAAMMLANPWVRERFPDYSERMARNDFSQSMALVESDVESIAKLYLAEQLGNIDEAIDILMGFARDGELKETVRIMALNAANPWVEKQIKIFGNFAAQRVKIDKRTVNIKIDDFQKMLEEHNLSDVPELPQIIAPKQHEVIAEEDDSIIEGETE